ncbi:MAG: argininosuccinate lyase [Actinomycetota bacterium]|nr:argininosuccinate lyase [Actinomycetota bacterium]
MTRRRMTLWGGRFADRLSDEAFAYTVDLADRRLLSFDLAGSIAHVEMLGATGIIAAAEARTIREGLERIAAEDFEFVDGDEDVHSAVERRLIELVGEVGEKLHTGRSRNDQIALDLRLYLRAAAVGRRNDLAELIGALTDQAELHADTAIPTYTHLQQAQPSTLGQHLLAHGWALSRDRERLLDLDRRLAESPLGAGASAGSSLSLDPAQTAAALGFASSFVNSLDAVGSRDVAAEFGFLLTQAMVNLSRLAEELVLWATSEFGWLSLSDAYATGSSALPHKKNPDVAELVRGRTASAIGHLNALLVLQKGLPLTYNRDLQEDKPALFWLDDTLASSCGALAGVIRTATFHPPAPSPVTEALGIAENLVRRGVPFRTAHAAVGKLVALLDGRPFTEASADVLDAAGVQSADLVVRPPQAGRSVADQVASLRSSTS